ncbi:hypothetical protein M3Y98_01161300 [Aphelenchoides besseyi]|nr:hypothetical protein M3Y98_01161300 [Aphelenchoides besseyi]KAI6210878.1 hypothetical protein M3Y96_00374500 [Aphelenchoides besseyi]
MQVRWQIDVLIFSVVFLLLDVSAVEVKLFNYGVGKKRITMVDETQFKHPNTVAFDDEIKKQIDYNDEYDELVPRLPRYEVHKFGKNIGYTLVPIVTREKPSWSTPLPRRTKEQPWPTPDVLKGITRQSWRPTTPMPSHNSRVEELLPTDPPTGIRPGIEDMQPIGSIITSTAVPKKHRLTNSKASSQQESASNEKEPQISLVTKTPSNGRLPTGFRRITISTTTLKPSTSSVTLRPVWHHPNFFATSQSVEASTQQSQSPRSRLSNAQQSKLPSSIQVSSLLEANENTQRPFVIHKVDSKMIEERTGGKRIFSTASDGTPVEIIMAPPTSKPIIQQKGSDASVRSNSFKIIPEANGIAQPTTATPQKQRQFTSWSRNWSWSVGPNGERTQHLTSSGNVQPSNSFGHLFPSLATTSTPVFSTSASPRRLPPPIIQTQANKYRGPTLNCRVLEAVSDGLAAADNDPTCKLLYPGYPLDNSCRCTFHVNGRDQNGCAMGFLYTCYRTELPADD